MQRNVNRFKRSLHKSTLDIKYFAIEYSHVIVIRSYDSDRYNNNSIKLIITNKKAKVFFWIEFMKNCQTL